MVVFVLVWLLFLFAGGVGLALLVDLFGGVAVVFLGFFCCWLVYGSFVVCSPLRVFC